MCATVSSAWKLLELETHLLTSLTSLFRPYIKLDLRGANLYPRDTCTLCANEISALTNALRAMYGLRRVCLPVTGFLLSASTIHLLNLPSETSAQHLSQGMRDLQTMSTNHFFAGRCVNIIRSLATKWQISLPDDAPCASPRPDLNGRKLSSPKSAFYSASIPRQNSSQSGTRSAESQESAPQSRKPSAPGHDDSPFAPPTLSSISQSQTPSSGANSDFFGNQFPSIDQVSGGQQQQQYWIPFPVQSMPNAHLADLQSTNSLNFLDTSTNQQWQQQYSLPPSQNQILQQHLQQQFPTRQQHTQAGADSSMGNTYENWHW